MGNLSKQAINKLRHDARKAVRELGLLNNAYSNIDVTLAERHLLIELSERGLPTATEIKEKLLLDKSTVSRLISRATKKGYVACKVDQKDKRNHLLYLTDEGKKTLDAFEKIAFAQTRGALATLTSEEIEIVYQGMALYAKGLQHSRQSKENPSFVIKTMKEIEKGMNKLGLEFRKFQSTDRKSFYEIFREVVQDGELFPYECDSMEGFERQFFLPGGEVYICSTSIGEVVGGFYLRSNYSGRSSHIANAAYMVRITYRGKGIGSFLVQASLHIAKKLGFRAMQYNMVLSENRVAIRLYQKLNFSIVGTIPEAVKRVDGSYQDGHVMYRKLEDLS